MKQKEEPRLTLPRPLTTTTTVINLDNTGDQRHGSPTNAASGYVAKGWPPLPLPEGQKYPPPEGTTGNHPYPDPADLFPQGVTGNLGLRMPTTTIDTEVFEVIGLDVDQYGIKTGAETLVRLTAKHGELPRTWRSTSRGPENLSGIRFYLVPEGRKWKGKPGADIEVIQRTHRYAVVWPSVVGGRAYRWYDADDRPCDVPAVRELPILPAAWQEFLRSSSGIRSTPVVRPMSDIDTADWLAEHGGGRPDASMRLAVSALPERMREGAYDTMVAATWRIIALAAEGHPGAKRATGEVTARYLAEHRARARRGDKTARPTAVALTEIARAVSGAVAAHAGSAE